MDKAFSALKNREYLGADAESRKRGADESEDMEPPQKRQAPGDEGTGEEMPGADEEEVDLGDEQLGPLQAPEQGRVGAQRGARVPKGWCRDYHTVGYCTRGSNCKFQHSTDSIMGPMPNTGGMPPFPPGFMPPMPFGPDGQLPPEIAQAIAEGKLPPPPPPGFDPEQMMRAMQEGHMPMGMPFPMPPGAGGHGRGGPPRRGRGRGARAGMAGHMPAPRSQDTLVVENIPPEYLDLVPVNDYFKRFGTITNIQVEPEAARAVISYATPAEAEAAHKSPEVIFGNRFVKVYFQRLEPRPKRGLPRNGPPPSKPNYMTSKGSNVYLAPELREAAANSMAPRPAPAEDAEQRKELRRKKQALLNMQLAEQKSLLEKLDNKDITPQGRKSIMVMLEKLSGEIKTSTEMLKKDVSAAVAPGTGAMDEDAPAGEGEANPTTEQLKEKLASLKQEAASLGLDPSGAPLRGGFRGGYRGGFRGRGFRGRGAAPGFNRAQYKLDNRTTRVGVSNLPEGFDADKLREQMEKFGELQSVEAGDEGQMVAVYKTRASGEKAMRSGSTVPELSGAQLAWVEAPKVTAPAASEQDQLEAAAAAEGGEREENWKR